MLLDMPTLLLGASAIGATLGSKFWNRDPREAAHVIDWDSEADRERWLGPRTKQPLDESWFEVRETARKGKGLFAAASIERDTFLFDYKGILVKDNDFCGSDYAVGIRNAAGASLLIDGEDPATSNLARYLNHAANPNCVMMRAAYDPQRTAEGDPPPRLHMLTCRDVKQGEELCWDYGEQFWKGRNELRRREEQLRALELLAEAQQRGGSEAQAGARRTL